MKSHRKHKPLLPNERELIHRKGRFPGRVLGRKQRLDELQSAERSFWWNFEMNESGKAHEAACPYRNQGHKVYGTDGSILGYCWHGWRGDSLQRARAKYEDLWNKARKDGIV